MSVTIPTILTDFSTFMAGANRLSKSGFKFIENIRACLRNKKMLQNLWGLTIFNNS